MCSFLFFLLLNVLLIASTSFWSVYFVKFICFSQVLDYPFCLITKEILGNWRVGLVGFTVEKLIVCNPVVSFVLFSCLSSVWLFVTPWFTARQAPLSIISQSLLRFIFFESGCYLTISYSVTPFSFALCLSQHQGLFQISVYPDYVFGIWPKVYFKENLPIFFLCGGRLRVVGGGWYGCGMRACIPAFS